MTELSLGRRETISRDRAAAIVRTDKISTSEFCLAGVIGAILLGLRLLYTLHMKFNSDEPQHLHVVWGWTVGLLQYRDVFDNHTPLFHLLLSPVLRLVGERPDALFPMRFAMFPLWLGALAAIFQIFARTYTRRIGLWAAVFAAASPHFFLKMTEFRTDVLWTMLWLIALAWLVSGPPTTRRFFFAGLTLGGAFCVSMKTTLLLASIAIAGCIVWLFCDRAQRKLALQDAWPKLGGFLLGLVVVPSAIIAYFAAHHALGPFYYCVVEHNKLPDMGLFRRAKYHLVLIFGGGAALIGLARFARSTTPVSWAGGGRAFILLVTGLYYIALEGFWPMITFQDYMPFDPLFAGCLAPAAVFAGDWLAARTSWRPLRLAPVAILLIAAIARIGVGFKASTPLGRFAIDDPWTDATTHTIQRVADTLALTQPGDFVMDGKGETIFRPRSFYYVVEILTQKRMDLGFIKDTIIERLIDTKTAVVNQTRLPKVDIDFIQANYLSIGTVRVLGQHLHPSPDGSISFEIRVPGAYSIVSGLRDVPGILDGTPLQGSRALAPGSHVFQPSGRVRNNVIDLFLSRAHEKGYVPILAQYTADETN